MRITISSVTQSLAWRNNKWKKNKRIIKFKKCLGLTAEEQGERMYYV